MKKHLPLLAALIIPSGHPDIEITNFAMVEATGAKRSMELNAKTAKIYQEERLTHLQSLQSKVWSGRGAIYSIKADSSVLDNLEQDFVTDGKTSISTPDAYIFETSNIKYTASKKMITGEDKVVLSPISKLSIAGQKFYLEGVGLNMNLNNDKLSILDKVKAEQDNKSTKKLKITSKAFTFDTYNSNGVFSGNVDVRHPEYKMQGQTLSLNFRPSASGEQKTLQNMYLEQGKKNKVKAIIGTTTFRSKGFRVTFLENGDLNKSEALGSAEATLEGGISIKAEKLYSFSEDGVSKFRMEKSVEIRTTERLAKCQEAIYTPSTGEFQLFDVASLSDGSQNLKGKEIIFSTKDSFLKVKKASGDIEKSKLK